MHMRNINTILTNYERLQSGMICNEIKSNDHFSRGHGSGIPTGELKIIISKSNYNIFQYNKKMLPRSVINKRFRLEEWEII